MKRFKLLFLFASALIVLGCAAHKPVPVTPVALTQREIDAYDGKGCSVPAPAGWKWEMGMHDDGSYPRTFCADSYLVRQH